VIGALIAALAVLQDTPTFDADVAPIVFERCAACHRPGESAPFDLLTYRDVAKRASQVVEVTSSRYMPPWLPAKGRPFANDRSLSEQEVETFRRWAAAGAPEGDPKDLPPAPVWAPGWQLGEPDLVLETEPFRLAADGSDVFRNLIVPDPLERVRYVRALELRPGTPAVHHAVVQVDRTASCRALDADDEEPGFPGMSMGSSDPPDGHFIGWTPGHVPQESAPGMAWTLHPHSDLVVQLHMTRTGKEEVVRPQLGLYFADRPPDRFPFTIVLYQEDIDIPAGDPAYAVSDEYVLPVDVVAHGVYPHAHYLGKRALFTARFPDGEVEELLRIDDWDFNWQDEYRYLEPFVLPAGTRLVMEWTYDNSVENPRNPNVPPVRVRFGQRSEDEMGTMSLLVVPVEQAGLAELKKQRWADQIERKPWDWHACNMLAALLIDEGDESGAGTLLERALSLNPEFPDALANLGLLLQRRGSHAQAEDLFRRALAIQPDHPGANAKLAATLAATGRSQEAIALLRGALELIPDHAEVRVELGNLLALSGALHEAVEQYSAALELSPDLPEAHNNLANTWLFLDEPGLAIEQYRLAIEARPDYFNAHYNLGRVLLQEGDREDAIRHLRAAARIRPDDQRPREALEAAGGE